MKDNSLRSQFGATALTLILLACSSINSPAGEPSHGASMLLPRGTVVNTVSARSPQVNSLDSTHGASYIQQLAGKTTAPAPTTSQSVARVNSTNAAHGAAYLVGITNSGSTKLEVAPLR